MIMALERIANKRNLTSLLVLVFIVAGSSDLLARKRVVLSGSKSIQSQISVSDEGTFYVITESINLKNTTVRLPQDAILHFEGGCFSNGELIGNNATIDAGRYVIFQSISLSGTWTIDGIPVEWFGASPNNSNNDCSPAINLAISVGKRIGTPVLLGSGIYYTRSTIDIPETGTIIGLSPSLTTICYNSSCGIGVFMHGQYTSLRNVCVQEYKMGRKGTCVKLGDSKSKTSCTRGYVEDVKVIGGNHGLDLDYQWCNKISGVNSRYNNIGLYSYETTPFVENAIIEGNYRYGVYSEGAGVKLYGAIIEGNKVGCVLNGRDNSLINCYFEGNTASYLSQNPAKDKNGVDVEGGHLYVGEQKSVNSLVMIGCIIGDAKRDNNTIRIDKCLSFSATGCSSMKNFELTRKCTIKYVDSSTYKVVK